MQPTSTLNFFSARATILHILLLSAMATDQERLITSYKAAVAAHQAQDLDTALDKYRECLAIQPIPQVHNNMAAILLSRGEKSKTECVCAVRDGRIDLDPVDAPSTGYSARSPYSS